ncbi:MAG TPA: GspH/FimT family pseudopilin [Luteibacter sp.]|nr:GspH/FimT family pseudopilin [Luteibacter sp.]
MTSNRCKKQGGFTLIELVISVLVLAILTSLALPSFRDFMRRNAIAARSNELLGDVRYARDTASTRNIIISMCASNNAGNAIPTCSGDGKFEAGWLIYIATTSGQVFDGTQANLIKVNQGAADVSIRSNATQIISFDQRGASVSGAPALIVCSKRPSDTIGSSNPRTPGRRLDVQPSGRSALTPIASAVDESSAQGLCTPTVATP